MVTSPLDALSTPRHMPPGDIEATDKAMAGFMAGAPASRRKAWPPDVWWDGIGMRICCSCEWVEISDQLGIYIYIYCVYIYTAYIYVYTYIYICIYDISISTGIDWDITN